MKWWARYIIKDRIKVHERKRAMILYNRDQLWHHDKYYDELWEEGAKELQCADRMTKLLTKYQ